MRAKPLSLADPQPRSVRAIIAQQQVPGIDPGLARYGPECVDIDPRRQVRLVEVGVVRTSPFQSPGLRLLTITETIEDQIVRPGPSVVSIKRIFARDNLHSAIGITQITGTVVTTAACTGLEMA